MIRLLSIMLLCVGVVGVMGQPKSIVDKTIFVDYGDRFYADAYVVPTESSDTARVVVIFRMANDFLTFSKVTDRAELRGNYQAEMSVGIEVRDTMGVIRQRIPWLGSAFTNTFEETNNKNLFHYGWITFNITGGTYDISLEIIARKESNQKKITVKGVSFTPRRKLRLLTPPLFVEPVVKDGRELLSPFVFTGNVPFGSKDARALVLLSDSDSYEYTYLIRQMPWEIRDIRWWNVGDQVGTTNSSTKRFPRISTEASSDAPFLEVQERTNRIVALALVEVPISLTTLVPGKYQLSLIREGTTDTINITFRIVWEMMPLSLRNIDYAMKSMRYIVSESTLDSLNDGSDPERREHLMTWWRTQDPNPTTTFNERMAEYFKRLDQAFFAFSTIQEPDGAQSERGKVYVLYGAPTEIKKDLHNGNESLEVWTYANKVNKKISFLIDDRGIYKLKAVESAGN